MKCLLFHFCTWECLGTLQSYIKTSKKPKKGQKLLENIFEITVWQKKKKIAFFGANLYYSPKYASQVISSTNFRWSHKALFLSYFLQDKRQARKHMWYKYVWQEISREETPTATKSTLFENDSKSLIFCKIASEASYVYSLICEIQLFVYIFENHVSCLFTFFSQWQLFVY